MFTGIIEEVGTVQNIHRSTSSAILSIQADTVLDGTKTGDSIAVNGVCLTVTSICSHTFTADVMPETIKRSSLGTLTTGSHVNLERAMPADGRFGGHIVSGHIDGTGIIQSLKKDDNAVWYTISAPEHLLRYVIEKGSIAIDGISLTVAAVGPDYFQVSIIPHTSGHTTLSEKTNGDIVNLENDCIGKYVERLLCFQKTQKSSITEEFLGKYGFL